MRVHVKFANVLPNVLGYEKGEVLMQIVVGNKFKYIVLYSCLIHYELCNFCYLRSSGLFPLELIQSFSEINFPILETYVLKLFRFRWGSQ